MTAYFVDTSAIGKRYLVEIGSTWIESIAQPSSGNRIVISDLTEVEVWSAIERKLREARISLSDATRFQNEFMVDVKNQYITVAVSELVRKRARDLLSTYPLRAMDAIQLASALEILPQVGTSLIFVSADRALLSAAGAEGLATDNPLLHP